MLDVGSDPDTDAALKPATLDELRAATIALSKVVKRIDPDSVPLSQAFQFWQACDLIGRYGSNAAMALARRVDESDSWKKAGCASPDQFRARAGGIGLGDAKRQGKASRQLEDLPDTRDAMREGQLSPEQVELIADAAEANPAAEHDLIDSASKKGVKDLKDDCGRAKQQADRDPDATRRRVRGERRFGIAGRTDSSAALYGNGPTDEAAVLDAALQPIVDRFYRERRGTPEQAERQAYMWDALMEIVRGRVDSPAPATGDDTATGKRSRTRPDYLAILRIDMAALIRGWVEGDETCEIPGLGPVPISRAREMLSDSSIRLVITKGIDVANYTYLGRGPNAAQDIALLWSQGVCQNIACSHRHRERDHRDPHADVRCSELAIFDDLCDFDHDLETYQGWALVDGTGRRAFVAPTDPRHPKHTRAGPEPPDAPPDDRGHGPDPPPDQLF